MVNCPGCLSVDIRRARRRGFFDAVRSCFALWPYRCNTCKKRFSLRRRSFNPTAPIPAQPSLKPSIAFEAHTEKPIARVLIQAQSHEQLQSMLRTLSKAISAYGPTAPARTGKPAGTRRASQ